MLYEVITAIKGQIYLSAAAPASSNDFPGLWSHFEGFESGKAAVVKECALTVVEYPALIIITDENTVITSYSIHYTKLYEFYIISRGLVELEARKYTEKEL